MRKSCNVPIGYLDRSDAWHSLNSVSAKVGTQPWLIIFDRRTSLKPGNKIKFRKAERWSNWQNGIITDTEPVLFISLA